MENTGMFLLGVVTGIVLSLFSLLAALVMSRLLGHSHSPPEDNIVWDNWHSTTTWWENGEPQPRPTQLLKKHQPSVTPKRRNYKPAPPASPPAPPQPPRKEQP